MRLFVKLMLLLVVAALAGPFILKGPDGKPLWSIASVKASVNSIWQQLGNDAEQNLQAVGVDSLSDDVEIYRWQDENGQWHFSEQAPAGIAAETMTIDPDTNMISLPALPEPVVAEEAADDGDGATIQTTPPEGIPSAEDTRQLIEDVRNLQNVVNERDQKIRDADL
ncbi:MAG: DUF4124 domain-containing protein [Pseudomonadota bacterium]